MPARPPPDKRGSRALTRSALALAVVFVAGVFTLPVRAGDLTDTAQRLKEAKARLAQVQGEANAATARYEEARGRLILTQDQIRNTRNEIGRRNVRLERLRTRLGTRAREAYELGPTSTIELLLTAESFGEFSDRVVFLEQIQAGDADLVYQTDVVSEELSRLEDDLSALEEQQAEETSGLDEIRQEVFGKLGEAQALAKELQREFNFQAAAQAALVGAGSTTVVQGQALQACPVPGSSFVDSWGAPRSGGRRHQGVDMMAPSGSPIFAAQSGSVTHSSSSLGGIQAYVYGDGGDMTFYAHLSAYAGPSRHVGAGEQIGYVGDTGNARGTPHLHFEYHPGGGAAVNPTPYVIAVC